MHEDGTTFREAKACQINDNLVKALLQQMSINLPQKGSDVESPDGNRPHRIISPCAS
jgi:hypothetical protein